MTARVLMLVALAALLVPASSAAKTGPPLEAFPHQGTRPHHSPDLASDGARYFVINSAAGLVRVYDTVTDGTYEVAMPEACSVKAAEAAVALVDCLPTPTGDRQGPFLLDLMDGRLRAPANADDADADADYWTDIGRHWIRGITGSGIGKPMDVWFNWRTGRRVLSDETTPARDLDHPKLRRWDFRVLDRDGSLSIRTARPLRLVLGRPGPDAVLSRCSGECSQPTLSAGLVTWREDSVVRSYDARRRTRLGWYLDGYDPDRFHEVVHTRYHVLVAAQRDGGADLLWARAR